MWPVLVYDDVDRIVRVFGEYHSRSAAEESVAWLGMDGAEAWIGARQVDAVTCSKCDPPGGVGLCLKTNSCMGIRD